MFSRYLQKKKLWKTLTQSVFKIKAIGFQQKMEIEHGYQIAFLDLWNFDNLHKWEK